MKKVAVVIAILFIGILVLSSCGTNGAPHQANVKTTEKFKVGLSNCYIGNGWRTQMLDDFEAAAKRYQEEGIIESYIVQSSGMDVNNQIAQIRNMIKSDVDLLIIDPINATSLSPVIDEALDEGILVISSSMPVEHPGVINVLIEQKKWGATLAEWFVEALDGSGNVVLVKGLDGTSANEERLEGQREVLARYPDIRVLEEVSGNWDQTVAQQVMSNVLATYPNLDGVLTQDSMAMGVTQAFLTAKKELPVLTGETMVAYLKMWDRLKREDNFSTIGITNPPGMVVNALGVGVRLLQGRELKNANEGNMVYYDVKYVITNDNFDAFYAAFKDKPDGFYPDEWWTEQELDALFQ